MFRDTTEPLDWDTSGVERMGGAARGARLGTRDSAGATPCEEPESSASTVCGSRARARADERRGL